jgi:hypothetical protein
VATDTSQLKKKTRIVAGTDLPGVPEGTGGKVGTTIGLTKLVRYRVVFDNGIERMSVASNDLVVEDEWDDVQAERKAEAEAAAKKAAEAPAPTEDGAGAPAADGTADEGDKPAASAKDERMAALLAKSKAAKEKKLAGG